jgi:hypothetical protein
MPFIQSIFLPGRTPAVTSLIAELYQQFAYRRTPGAALTEG